MEKISDVAYPVRLIWAYGVNYPGPMVPELCGIGHYRMIKTFIAHVEGQLLSRFLLELLIKYNGWLPNAPQPIMKTVVLVG